jgi:hypothetical protein
MDAPRIEGLEGRRLLSVNVAESEPNNTMAAADVLGRVPDESVKVTGKIGKAGDRDWFRIKLKAGDVFAAAVTGRGGLDTNVRLVDAAGALLISNDDSFRNGRLTLPHVSPLPRAYASDTDAEIYQVITRPGTYYVEVSASSTAGSAAAVGKYEMELMAARPGMEKQPVGAKQVLFLDFDGAEVDFGDFDQPPKDHATLSPMVDFLEGWKLTAADESALIDNIIARVTKYLSGDVKADGLNGDYDRTRRPGEFGLEIRNSRDHRDTFGIDPLVSRIVVGGTAEEAGFDGYSGLAETLDVGNFKTSDQGVGTLSWITDGIENIGFEAPVTRLDLMAEGIALLVAHEAGHIFGCFHTDQADFFGETANIMDPALVAFIGPDLILGSEDDVATRFGVDLHDATFLYAGVNDTLNTLAFGLSTGTVRGHGRGGHGHGHAGAFAGNFPWSAVSPSLFNSAREDAENAFG